MKSIRDFNCQYTEVLRVLHTNVDTSLAHSMQWDVDVKIRQIWKSLREELYKFSP